ncbi:unnamed protein product [Rotaria sordida]|uniref:WW domain-containing protein n=1 Tax=Rotaria sordida TaxID=392033 RepID=A0A815H3X5_9BILA|nr:unnamed protein product [Rotaria sordida]CAF3892290.1 unnamed protein product [Rotaria sordida]
MTDYWKSGERHYCKFCKCWLAGNKISIDLHERGNHHKNMVKVKLDQLRKESIEKEHQNKQLNQTLGQMERAANESFRRDMASNAKNLSHYDTGNDSTSSDINLPSKLKRSIQQPVQVQCKKPKFVIKTPTPKPVFEPIVTSTESNEKIETKKEEEEDEDEDEEEEEEEEEKEKPTITDNNNQEGTWYESKTETQESFYWNDTTGESTWTPPAVYLSIEQQRAKGLKV